nr:centrosomal protein of 120 kDa-like [Leptinotarsa decemlineata]
MHQLSGKYVNVVLSVECGRGMDFLKNNVHVTGNFNNRILESDKIPAEEYPPFNTELIWEIEKKELRKIRSANVPLRVECITTDVHNRKERVGFALLSLRSAKIIPEKNAHGELSFAWHRLIGCQADKKKSHPELYISLTLRDFIMNDVEVKNSADAMPYISEEDVHLEESKGSEFPIKYFEDGHIQVGDEEDAENTFTLNLLVKEVVNLDGLLPEILVFQKNTEDYFISFKILGVSIKTKPFRKQLHSRISLNEKIVVKLLSTEQILGEFFKTQSVVISFCCGKDKLGVTELELMDVFDRKDSKCFFKFPSPNGIIPFGSTDKSPYIELQTWLEASPSQKTSEEEIQEKPKARTIFSNISRKPDDSGDVLMQNEENIEKDMKITPKKELVLVDNTLVSFTTKSMNTLIKSDPLSARLPNPMDSYHKYLVEINLQHLIWKKNPHDTKLMFKFLHPRAASCTTILAEISDTKEEKITLNNLSVKLSYLSIPDKIEKLLKFWPPRLVLADDSEILICREHVINMNCLRDFGLEYEATLYSLTTSEALAKVGVDIRIKVGDVEESDDYHLHLLPVIIDEIITAKEISDLQKWKQQEMKRFEDELSETKRQELKKLEEEWNEKKEKLENQLTMTINKCKYLQEELVKKMNGLKTEKILRRKQNESHIYESIFKENWKNFSSENSKELIEAFSKTQRDNQLLKEICDEQRQKLSQLEKSTLTKSQTTNLLQELRILEQKFEDAQRAKRYFKEQWQRACEEIHELKTEDLKNLQIQIKQSKEELSQLSLEKYSEYDKEGSDEYDY